MNQPKDTGSRLGARVRSTIALFRKGPEVSRTGMRPTAKAIRETAADARRSRIPQMAAALSYRTIFGMIPMIVVALVVLKSFTTDEHIARLLSDSLQYAGLADIAVSERVEPELEPGRPPVSLHPDDQPETAPDGGAARLDQWIKDLVGRANSIQFAAIGWIGLAMLIYAAMATLVEIERAFNQIYRVPVGRTWVRRITQYWTLLTLGSLGLFATFYVGEQFKSWAVELATSNGVIGGGGITIGVIGFAVTVAISTLFFLLAYTTVPNTRVKFNAAIAGALVAALLWETGKWAFTQYIRMSASDNYGRLYGSIALLPLFLLWIYFTWLIVLFGLQISYHIQHIQARTVALPEEDETEPVIVDPSAILAVMLALADRFSAGEPAEAPKLAERVGLGRPIVEQMLKHLTEAGFVHRVLGPDDAKTYTLARSPDHIEVTEVLALGDRMAGSTPSENGFAADLRRSRLDSMKGRTLASLAPPQAPPAPGESQPSTA